MPFVFCLFSCVFFVLNVTMHPVVPFVFFVVEFTSCVLGVRIASVPLYVFMCFVTVTAFVCVLVYIVQCIHLHVCMYVCTAVEVSSFFLYVCISELCLIRQFFSLPPSLHLSLRPYLPPSPPSSISLSVPPSLPP